MQINVLFHCWHKLGSKGLYEINKATSILNLINFEFGFEFKNQNLEPVSKSVTETKPVIEMDKIIRQYQQQKLSIT